MHRRHPLLSHQLPSRRILCHAPPLRRAMKTLVLGVSMTAALGPLGAAQARPRTRTAKATVATVAPSQRGSVSVTHIAGRRVEAKGPAAGRWVPKMVVWILEPGGGLPLCEAEVRFRHGDRVILELPDGAPTVPVGAVVEPRWVAEARLYGAKRPGRDGALGKPDTQKSTVKSALNRPWRVWHRPPKRLTWGKSLWVELVATSGVSAPRVRWRVGRAGPFADLPMTAAADGRWTARLQPGQTPPRERVLQYYVGAAVKTASGTRNRVVVAHAAHPHEVRIDSVPRHRRRARVDHQPPTRWTHKRALVLSARVDKRYRAPVVFFRARGGGTFDVIKMRRISPEVWRAEVPAARVVVPGLSYYLAATDQHGVTRPIFRTPRRPMNVRVTRGKILSTQQRRDRVSASWTQASHGSEEDAWQRVDIGLERLFFGFLVGRLGATATWGRAMRLDEGADGTSTAQKTTLASRPMNLYGGHAGLELRAGDYLRASGDLLMAIHNGGAGLGYRLTAHIGDEAGANLFASWAGLHDVDTADLLMERLRLGLSTPIGPRLRLAGVVVHESVLQDSNKALRFQVELTWAVARRLFVTGRVGFSGRDADNPGSTAGAGVALTF
ncbi:MAG: hypothetical protein KC502_13050 [Myxococcales bacterium]|nr:hypothetical protein [Myxococcales bacterium]